MARSLSLLAGLVAAVFKWPRPIFLVVYLAICAGLIAQSIRRIFFISWRMEA